MSDEDSNNEGDYDNEEDDEDICNSYNGDEDDGYEMSDDAGESPRFNFENSLRAGPNNSKYIGKTMPYFAKL